MNSDLLDEYCEANFGHTDWVISFDENENITVTFLKNARVEYLVDQESEEEPMRMRKDLAREGIQIPACFSYSNYDTMDEPVIYLSAEDMDGAVSFDNGVDTDDHAFCVVKLKDGKVVYMLGIDLDWGDID